MDTLALIDEVLAALDEDEFAAEIPHTHPVVFYIGFGVHGCHTQVFVDTQSSDMTLDDIALYWANAVNDDCYTLIPLDFIENGTPNDYTRAGVEVYLATRQ